MRPLKPNMWLMEKYGLNMKTELKVKNITGVTVKIRRQLHHCIEHGLKSQVKNILAGQKW